MKCSFDDHLSQLIQCHHVECFCQKIEENAVRSYHRYLKLNKDMIPLFDEACMNI